MYAGSHGIPHFFAAPQKNQKWVLLHSSSHDRDCCLSGEWRLTLQANQEQTSSHTTCRYVGKIIYKSSATSAALKLFLKIKIYTYNRASAWSLAARYKRGGFVPWAKKRREALSHPSAWDKLDYREGGREGCSWREFPFCCGLFPYLRRWKWAIPPSGCCCRCIVPPS